MRSRLLAVVVGCLVSVVLALPGCTGEEGPQMPPIGGAYEKAEDGMSLDDFKALLPQVSVTDGAEEGEKWAQAVDEKFIYGFKFEEGKLVEKTKSEKAN